MRELDHYNCIMIFDIVLIIEIAQFDGFLDIFFRKFMFDSH